MPPIKESTQQTAGASAPLNLPTQSDEVDPGLERVSATACFSGVAAANTARCGWETDMEKRTSATEEGMSATEQGMSATEQGISATEQGMNATGQGMSATEQGMSATEQGMSATEQGMSATEQCMSTTKLGMSATKQGMSATEQGMSATEQRMNATEQGTSAIEQRMSATEQRVSAAEEGISATEQRMRATEQFGRKTRRELRELGPETRRELHELGRETRRELGELRRETRRELGEMRELLQAALPNAANVAGATASCSQEATMATINTGIVGCLNVLPIEAQGIKYCVVTISLHVRVSEKISDNLACTLKFYHVSTIASEINVNQQGFSLAVRPGDGGNPLSMSVPGLMQRVRYFCDIPDLHVPDET